MRLLGGFAAVRFCLRLRSGSILLLYLYAVSSGHSRTQNMIYHVLSRLRHASLRTATQILCSSASKKLAVF
ncbi:MAG: hypothetical protein ACLFSQ_09860, partial [Candidatus Zixiibacteriota bacterium]